MGKLKYTKEQMEEIICIQLDNLIAIGEQAQLYKQQNELLTKVNQELREELVEYKKKKNRIRIKK